MDFTGFLTVAAGGTFFFIAIQSEESKPVKQRVNRTERTKHPAKDSENKYRADDDYKSNRSL